jgi:drug/metabolite transporter (DMT)-like permease
MAPPDSSAPPPKVRLPSAPARADAIARGVVLMLLSSALLTLNDGVVKALVAQLPTGQVVALRGTLALVLVLTATPFFGGRAAWRITARRSQAIFALTWGVTMLMFAWGLVFLPLTDSIVLVYSSPLFVTALAPKLLGEKVGWRRWTAVAAGFMGVALVMRPTAATFQWAAFLPLLGAFALAYRAILARSMVMTESSLSIVGLGSAASAVIGTATSLFAWQLPTIGQSGLILLASVFFITGHFTLVEAFRFAGAATLSPFKYSAILWAILIGLLSWGEAPDGWDLVGSALIAASGIVIIYRSRRRMATG